MQPAELPTIPARRAAAMVAAAVAAVVGVLVILTVLAGPAAAQGPELPEVPEPDVPGAADDGLDPRVPGDDPVAEPDDGAISIDIGTAGDQASESVLLIVGLAVLSLAPSLVLMLSSFTRMIVVLSLTRNALGLQGIPPNQVLIGLALFLSLFVMAPTLSEVNEIALEPYLDGQIGAEVAYNRGTGPMREFMLAHTRTSELELLLDAADRDRPGSPDDIDLATLIPAFLLSELKTAFIIGFVVFIPFLVIDVVVAAALMSLGMMMLPPVFVSLPFKLLLFIMVGGWSMIVETLLASFS